MSGLAKISISFVFMGLIFGLLSLSLMAQGPEDNFASGIQICQSPLEAVTLVNPVTITNCTQAGIQTALDTGGHIAFDCGPEPVTIPLASQLQLNPTVDTVIDGGGLVTLDGQNTTRILYKDWHNIDTYGPITVTLQNIRFINGRAPAGGSTGNHSGGAVEVGYSGTSLHVINATFENNRTTSTNAEDNQGGAIFVHNAYETILSGSVFEGNSAGSGGAFGGISTNLYAFNSRFTNNRASDTSGGGIVRGYGGAIALDGVTHTTLPASDTRVHVCGSVFESNTAIRGGGAIDVVVSDNRGTLATYEKSTFEDNEVSGLNGQYGQGGAIYHIEDDHAGADSEQNFAVIDSTFHNNRAGRQGGAVWVYILGHGDITNSTFEGNSTIAGFNQVGQGGALAVTLGTIDITNVTFAYNHADYQGGAMHGGGGGNAITLKNTIFLSNTLNFGQTQPSETKWQGYHTNRPMTDGGQNIQFPRLKPGYDNEVNNNITANPIYQNPLLKDLADNGGPNQTMALPNTSPAVDAGTSGCPSADQRGIAREGQCDIGAYEFASALIAQPAVQAVSPGQTTFYQLAIETRPGVVNPFNLSYSNSYSNLMVTLNPATITAAQSAIITLTDTHSGTSLIPGEWHTLPFTASGGGLTLKTDIRLLVGGRSVYLPLALK